MLETFDYGEALKRMLDGKHVARLGWNGKNLEIIYREGYPDGIPCNESTAKAYGLRVGDPFYCSPYFQIHNKLTHKVDMWVASTNDSIATDWYEVTGGSYENK